MDHQVLGQVILLLSLAAVAVGLFKRFNLPSILAYLLVGLLLGPHGFGFVDDSEVIQRLAEIGVVFLLFTVGLEFSLTQMFAMKKEVFVFGGLQVAFTSMSIAAFSWWLGMSYQAALVIGVILTVSSTAIVVKLLTEQMELQSVQGRNAVGILLFQDLAVVPFLILIPALAGEGSGSVLMELAMAMAKGSLVFFFLLAIGHWVLRPLFKAVATLQSAELFTITVLLTALAASWITHQAGLSLALGAFIAGMMMSETEYRHQVETDIRPFRDLLLGLFFISIGMLVNAQLLYSLAHWVILTVLGLILLKALLVVLICRMFDVERVTAIRTGLIISQCGEFGFALLSLALLHKLLDAQVAQVILGSVVGSMVLAAPIIRLNGKIADWFGSKDEQISHEQQVHTVAEDIGHIKNHVLILRYGRIGQNLAWFVESEGFPYIAIDLDPVRVQEARAAGESVMYGDYTHPDILMAARIQQAKIVVITVAQANIAEKILHHIRNIAPKVPVVVRGIQESHFERLQNAGATTVVPEKLEASLMLASQVLILLGISPEDVSRDMQEVRRARYQSVLKIFPGHDAVGVTEEDLRREILHSVEIEEEDFAVHRTIGDLQLQQMNVQLDTLRKDGIRVSEVRDDTQIHAADVLVLYGKPEDVERAEAYITIG